MNHEGHEEHERSDGDGDDTNPEAGDDQAPGTKDPAAGRARWEDAPVEVDQDDDPLAQPKPEVEFDQRVQW